jgi:hypothetical protein
LGSIPDPPNQPIFSYLHQAMSHGTMSYIAQRTAEAEAAKIIGQAIDQARAILKEAEIEDVNDVLQTIWEADDGE